MNTKRPAKVDNYLNQIVERLKAADLCKILLFGSYSKGTTKPGSGIDLMVVLDSAHAV
ncbi:MAG: nucleotidyltransferase domain-containing protein [Endomicrobium sp.]|jgi:predicted nucleotidyltransferase|nr:nucleotidyltransferase domain-containing protein [Endomicrobium sp.]